MSPVIDYRLPFIFDIKERALLHRSCINSKIDIPGLSPENDSGWPLYLSSSSLNCERLA